MSDEKPSEAMKFALAKPIQAHGEELKAVTFREPTAGDIIKVGNPVILDMATDPPVITHDARKMTSMIAALANIPPSSVAQMAPNDWVGCAWLLSPFFTPASGVA